MHYRRTLVPLVAIAPFSEKVWTSAQRLAFKSCYAIIKERRSCGSETNISLVLDATWSNPLSFSTYKEARKWIRLIAGRKEQTGAVGPSTRLQKLEANASITHTNALGFMDLTWKEGGGLSFLVNLLRMISASSRQSHIVT